MSLRHPFLQSLFAHLAVLAVVLFFVFKPKVWRNSSVDFEVIQFSNIAPVSVSAPPVDKPLPRAPEKKAVFGVSRKALTATNDSADTAAIKQGNTVSKEPDQLKLNPEDEDSLPIPADDFLVSSMPKIKAEIRIPYPESARQANVEGPVVMDLLIDAQGQVRQVALVKGPGFGLNEAAVEAARKFQFVPAKMGEQAVAVKIRYIYRFVLENK